METVEIGKGTEVIPEAVVAERTKDLDLRPHPTDQKQLSPKKLKELKQKLADRTITKEEYKQLDWNQRFKQSRKQAVDDFWIEERKRLIKRCND